jgi:hypothetical protein
MGIVILELLLSHLITILIHHIILLESFEETNNAPFVRNMPGQEPNVFFNDPTILEHILKTNFNNYVKGEHFYIRGFDILGMDLNDLFILFVVVFFFSAKS